MTLVCLSMSAAFLGACASSPPTGMADPYCRGLTPQQCNEMHVEESINRAMRASAAAGGDYMQVYINGYTVACINGTVTDKAKCDEVAKLRAERAQNTITVRSGN